MSPKKRVRVNAGGFQHSNHEILGGKGKVFRVPNSGDVYQFQMWIPEEKKYLRKSLKTKDLETAMKRGEDLKKKKDRIPDFMTTFNNYKKSFNKEKFKNNSKNMGESLKKFSLYKEKLFEIFK